MPLFVGLKEGGENFSEEVWSEGGMGLGSESGSRCAHLLDYAQGSLVPCMESIMTEDRLKEVKAGKLCPAWVRLQGAVRERVGPQSVIGKGRDGS